MNPHEDAKSKEILNKAELSLIPKKSEFDLIQERWNRFIE